MPILAVSYGTSSMSLSCRVQKIWSHKITKATNYDAGIMYTSLGSMPSLLHVLAVSNNRNSMSTVCRVREIWSHRITNAYIPKPTTGLAVPNLMWMS